jgi:hypothetical protein
MIPGSRPLLVGDDNRWIGAAVGVSVVASSRVLHKVFETSRLPASKPLGFRWFKFD